MNAQFLIQLALHSRITLLVVLMSTVVFFPCKAETLVELPNPLQGTDSVREFSRGNLYPAIATPFGMGSWAPYTQPVPDSFYYQYRQLKFRGIRHTQQPSPWINEYGAYSFMPVVGQLLVTDSERVSDFSHDQEVAQPNYYRAYLASHDATIEVTPTRRCASFRVTYGKTTPAYLVIDAFPGGSSVQVEPDKRRIIGTSRYNHGGVPKNYACYFVVEFDRPFKAFGTWTPKAIKDGQPRLEGNHVGAYVEFDVSGDKIVPFRAATSFISHEQAAQNLKSEIGNDPFDIVRKKAADEWNRMLGLVEIKGGTPEQRRTFYSALYRSMLFPHRFYEVDRDGNNRYYSPYDGQVHDGVMYTDSGLWDTFRALHPLLNILAPETNAKILQGMLAAYGQSGWLPAWSSPGHRDCMIGNHAFSLFADAWVKGIRDFDAELALKAMAHNARHQGPISSIGRDGASYYWDLGFLPTEEIREATAKTLEFAYNDYCASILAKELGHEELAQSFFKGSENWRNVFDPEIGFVRGRHRDRVWATPFHPDEWGGPFTEGSSWHWTWCVFHDIDGLIEAMGGREAFAQKLNSVFEVPPTVRPGSYGGLIHEMTEMIALDMGQYAHGNQPIQHMPYLYVHAGQPWKTQQRVRQIMAELYDSSPRGLCGDEDNGQTSAWYVFSAIGFYPVTPGQPIYVLGSPLFDRAKINLPSGKQFVVKAENNGPQNVYIQSATLNDKPLNRAWLTHSEIANGGELVLQMGPSPNKRWAVKGVDNVSQY